MKSFEIKAWPECIWDLFSIVHCQGGTFDVTLEQPILSLPDIAYNTAYKNDIHIIYRLLWLQSQNALSCSVFFTTKSSELMFSKH